MAGDLEQQGNYSKTTQEVTSKLVAVPHIPSLNLRSTETPEVGPESTPPSTASLVRYQTSSSDPPTHRVVTSAQEVKQEYDVYAAPFIPWALRAINFEPAHVVVTPPTNQIDYGAYIEAFACRSFMPDRVDVSRLQLHYDSQQTDHVLIKETYIAYFSTLLRIEIAAKERENQDYSLYKVALNRIVTPDGQELYALSVPGLREDSPLIEMGDMLYLRQLWVDDAGNLMSISWTGIQHNAVVYGINRKQETIYLKVHGLIPLSVGMRTIPLLVNVLFPLKQRHLDAQRMALAYVGENLQKVGNWYRFLDKSIDANEQLSREAASFILNDRHGEVNGHRQYASAQGWTEQAGNDWIRKILFPEEADGIRQTKLRSVPHRQLFDHDINYEQAHAVNSLCSNDYGTLPYLISGPPGTGKTKTLIEIAMQLLKTTNISHILICAPSDQAADTLALRLMKYLSPNQLFRLNGPGRADNEVPRELLPYSFVEYDMFYLPRFRKLMAFNIVVVSCRDAAILAKACITNNDLWTMEKNMRSVFHPEEPVPVPSLHWGALIIDEAAQATELDVLPAISVACPPFSYPSNLPQPRLVMAGDENQLGPRTASREPRFSTSLFARLLDRPIYRNHPLSRSNLNPSSGPPVLNRSMLPMLYAPFTNLIRNYRSHPSILSVPSSLFYADTLLPEAPIPSTPLQNSTLWKGRKWPVLFIPHTGPDEIERDGGGWYNISEAHLACDIAQLVVESRVSQPDICIMSPFAAQVKLLRSIIRSSSYGGGRGLWGINIGPLEAFQGLEKRVVIICTTRTRERFLEMDAKRGLGIIHQPRKMNVALTRAMEGLFVIGNPDVLEKDEHWKAWLAFCTRNGLVSDPGGIWQGKGDSSKIGVLERALIAKQDRKIEKDERILGASAALLDMDLGLNHEYESWLEELRETLEKGFEEGEEGEEASPGHDKE